MRRFSVATTCAWGGGWGVRGGGGGANECGASISAVMCTIADGASSLGHFSFFSCIRSKNELFGDPLCTAHVARSLSQMRQNTANTSEFAFSHFKTRKMLSVTVTRLPESRLPSFGLEYHSTSLVKSSLEHKSKQNLRRDHLNPLSFRSEV